MRLAGSALAALVAAGGAWLAVTVTGGSSATWSSSIASNSGWMKGYETLGWRGVPDITGYALFRDGVQVSTAGPYALSAKFYVQSGQHTLEVWPIFGTTPPPTTTAATTTSPTTTAATTTAATTTAPTPSPTSGWFAADSYINTKVPTTPTVDPSSAAWMSLLLADLAGKGFWSNGTQDAGGGAWSTTVYHATNATAKVTVVCDVVNGAQPVVPWPSGMVATPDSDAHLTVINDDTGDYWEFQGLDVANRHAHSYGYGNVYTGDGTNTGHNGNQASGLPLIAGLIRPDSVAAGVIPYGIRIAIAVTGPTFRYPSVNSDGTHAGGVPFGAHLWLPRSVDLATFGLNPYQVMLARALQDYGAWVGDTAGSGTLAGVVVSVADGKTTYPFSGLTLPNSLVQRLVVLTS